jgi:hypothetical protein
MIQLTIRRRSALPLLSGLAVAQLIATLFVCRSDLDLRQSVAAMQRAGWFAIPAGPAVKSLNSFGAAFWGGLFYTLSVGAGLVLATWAVLYLWRRFCSGRWRLLWPAACIWAALIIWINWHGWVLFATLFVFCVPLAVVATAVQSAQNVASPGGSSRLWPLPLVTLVVLTGMWSTQLNAKLFTDIRDHLLLSNPIGRTVNDFYYRYTLNAAQAFKSFDQKTLRTCRLELTAEAGLQERWIKILADHDVVAVQTDPRPDVIVRISHEQVQLISPVGDRIEVDSRTFSAHPGVWLHRFSAAADRYAPLRRLTFVGLLLGFPVLLFVMVDGAVGRLAGLFADEPARVWWRCGFCLGIGILLLIPMVGRSSADLSRDAIGRDLSARNWPERVAALHLIERQKLDIGAFPQYHRLLNSPLVVERYYIARALAFSHTPATFADLLTLIHDAQPNVVCQAYYALGHRGNPIAVAAIKTQMARSDHWYTQWYGYRAIRSLGWHQSR